MSGFRIASCETTTGFTGFCVHRRHGSDYKHGIYLHGRYIIPRLSIAQKQDPMNAEMKQAGRVMTGLDESNSGKRLPLLIIRPVGADG